MLKFNEMDLPNFVKVSSIDVQVVPTIDFATTKLHRGSISSATSLGSKVIKVSFSVVPNADYPTLESCSRTLAVWLKGDNFNLSKLIIATDPNIYYMAKLSSTVSLSDLIYAGKGDMTFIVPSGLGINITADKPVGNYESVSIAYTGTSPAPVSLRCQFTTAITNDTLVFAHSVTGAKYSVTGSFKAGDLLTIDTSTDIVKLNDTLSLSMISYDSEIIEVDAGTQDITCNNNTVYYEVSHPTYFL